MDKPITVARQEFIESTVISINQSGLPAFVLAEVLQGLVNTLRQQEQQQLERDMEAYKKETNDPFRGKLTILHPFHMKGK